MIERVWQL